MTMRFIGSNAWSPRNAPQARLPGPSYDFGRGAPMAVLEESGAGSRLDWALYGRSIYKMRWLILAVVTVVTVLTALYAQTLPSVYRSTSTMLVESAKAKIVSIEEVYNSASQDREYFQTQVEILRSHQVALRTVMATRLWEEPEFDPRKTVRSWQGKVKDLINPPPKPLPWTEERLAQAVVGSYLGAITIEPVRLSQLVKVSFDAQDPLLAAKIADAAVSSFIEADRDARLQLNQSVNGLLQDRMIALRDKLRQSEDELQRFRESSGLVSVSGSQGIAGQRLAEVGQRLITASVRRTELESAYQQVMGAADADILVMPVPAQHPGLSEARNRVVSASQLVDELTQTLGEQNTRVVDARSALAAARRELAAQNRAAVASLRRDVAAARETERALQAALGSARSAMQGVNRQEFQLGVLEREVQSNRQLFEIFLSRIKETGVSDNLQAAIARIVDPARPATAPLRPNKTQLVLSAMLLSLFCASGAAVARDRLAGAVRGSAEAEQRLQHPVLATLPAVQPMKADGLESSFLYEPRSNHSDAIRTARTNIVLSDMLVTHKLVVVTSALPGEGKTNFCTNLALALAQAKRTLLIDCDLRNPQVGFRLGLPADAKGISDYMKGGIELKDCIHSISGSTLLVMPAGDVSNLPEELLLAEPFRTALRALASRVDMVLIDTPAVSAGGDALILAQQAHETIFVVKSRQTTRSQARQALDQLTRAGANILGLVLTNAEDPSRQTLRRRGARSGDGSSVFGSNSVFDV